MRGREPVKRERIVSFLRAGIVAGQWRPGEQLPPRPWFEQHFEAASHTVQDAFRELLDAGFLLAERRRGTRVHPAPPHLTRYALLLRGPADRDHWQPRGLCAAAELLQQRGCDWRIHFDLNREPDDPAHLALLREIEQHGYAGLFLEGAPPAEQRSPLWQFRGIPITGFFSSDFERPPEVAPCSRPPGDPELEFQLLRALAEAGVRRPALLRCAAGHDDAREQQLYRAIAELGMSSPPGYLLEFHPEAPEQSRNVLRLLFAGHNRLRPDGLALADERFLPHATEVFRELSGSGFRETVRVVSAAHLPEPPPSGLPDRLIGIDLLRTLENAQRFIDDLRAGRSSPPPLRVRFDQPRTPGS